MSIKAKIAAELAERVKGGESLAMDYASRMKNKSSAIGAGTAVGAGLLGSDDSEASFIGTAAKTWNKGAEALAKKMADEGATRDEIWQATGAMGAPTFKDSSKWYLVLNDLVRSAYENEEIQFLYPGFCCSLPVTCQL